MPESESHWIRPGGAGPGYRLSCTSRRIRSIGDQIHAAFCFSSLARSFIRTHSGSQPNAAQTSANDTASWQSGPNSHREALAARRPRRLFGWRPMPPPRSSRAPSSIARYSRWTEANSIPSRAGNVVFRTPSGRVWPTRPRLSARAPARARAARARLSYRRRR